MRFPQWYQQIIAGRLSIRFAETDDVPQYVVMPL
jgi:hypothetical protein